MFNNEYVKCNQKTGVNLYQSLIGFPRRPNPFLNVNTTRYFRILHIICHPASYSTTPLRKRNHVKAPIADYFNPRAFSSAFLKKHPSHTKSTLSTIQPRRKALLWLTPLTPCPFPFRTTVLFRRSAKFLDWIFRAVSLGSAGQVSILKVSRKVKLRLVTKHTAC